MNDKERTDKERADTRIAVMKIESEKKLARYRRKVSEKISIYLASAKRKDLPLHDYTQRELILLGKMKKIVRALEDLGIKIIDYSQIV